MVVLHHLEDSDRVILCRLTCFWFVHKGFPHYLQRLKGRDIFMGCLFVGELLQLAIFCLLMIRYYFVVLTRMKSKLFLMCYKFMQHPSVNALILKSLLSSSAVILMWIRRRELKQHWALERWTGLSHTLGFLLWLADLKIKLFPILRIEFGRKFRARRVNCYQEQARRFLLKQLHNQYLHTIVVFQLPRKLCDDLNAMWARFWWG